MSENYNANLFELNISRPLNVSIYLPNIEPNPEYSSTFYQLLGRIAKKLTTELGTAVISENGSILVLEGKITDSLLSHEITLPAWGSFSVNLNYTEEREINYLDEPAKYGRFVSKIVDLALVHFSSDFYKYRESSPKIIESGEGYFDESLRQLIGIEDGRVYYRGVRYLDGSPHLLLNREIELRSYKNLLNELKILCSLWGYRNDVPDIDFYNPPDEFISYINRTFHNKPASVIKYSSGSIRIKEITWAHRARERILEGDISPVEYHKNVHGFDIEDHEQPLVIWEMQRNGVVRSLFHVPEILVVGHNFKDLNMRVSKTRTSQVFDLIHPNCAEHFRKIFEIVNKVDNILRINYSMVYPNKIEFSKIPKNIDEYIFKKDSIILEFKDKDIEITPPYSINFYRKYTDSLKFIKPLEGTLNILTVCEDKDKTFIESLISEIENRNECEINITYVTHNNLENIMFIDYNHVITISDDEKHIHNYKELITGKLGITHQNINHQSINKKSIPQLAMQITLKLGGYPWFVKTEDMGVLTIYSYRNPFSGVRFYVYNIMKSKGEVIYQSLPYSYNELSEFLSDIHTTISNNKELLILLSYVEYKIRNIIMDELKDITNNYAMYNIFQFDELRMFSTYKPRTVSKSRRRRRKILSYPIESIESAPQGIILTTSELEFYHLPTSSTKVRTYYRGCPKTVKYVLLQKQGQIDIEKIYKIIASMSVTACTSGHATRLPASLYYLKLYSKYVNNYPLPTNKEIIKHLFYV